MLNQTLHLHLSLSDIITYPLDKQTIPAGPITITWNTPTNIKSKIINYEIFINGQMAGTVKNSDPLTYKYYSTSVGSNKLQIFIITQAHQRKATPVITYYIWMEQLLQVLYQS